MSFPKYEYYIADQKICRLIKKKMNFPAYGNEEGVNSLIKEIQKIKC